MHFNAKREIQINAPSGIHSDLECSQPKSQKFMTSLQLQTYYRITCGITSYGMALSILTGNVALLR